MAVEVDVEVEEAVAVDVVEVGAAVVPGPDDPLLWKLSNKPKMRRTVRDI
jgi:hypothetical protein